jgi:hypothetical protein
MKGIIIFSVLIISLAGGVFAEIVDLNVKENFEIGEIICFNHSFFSEANISLKYFAYVNCPDVPFTLLDEKSIYLERNQFYWKTFCDITLDESIEPQICTANIQIIEPFEKTYSKEFSIIIDPSFDFKMLFCKDQSCTEKTKVFIQREEIYLDYESSVENPLVTANLIYPDESIKLISLPTSIKLDQIGTYELEVTVIKEGYKTIRKKEMFGIIKGYAQIENISKDLGVGFENLQEEGKEKVVEKKDLKKVFYWVGGIIILLLVILIVLNKRENNQLS